MHTIRYCLIAFCLTTTATAQAVFPVRDEGEAPSKAYDVQHYRIEVSFDEANREVSGRVAITFVPYGPDLTLLTLDAEEMQIRRVLFGGKDLPFTLTAKQLLVPLGKSYSFTDTLTVTVEYTCRPNRGLYFVQPDSGYPATPWQIWTQGEDMDSHFWFPCYDFPNDKATTEVLATVRRPYVALSNGLLESVTDDENAGTRTFHWRQNTPHVSYLVMLAAGDYVVLRDSVGRRPLEYYVYPGTIADAKVCFAQTPDMIRFFNTRIGFAYPWDKYAQVLIRDFVVGGMENTSATALLDNITIFDSRARLDQSPVSLIAHELAHQWWGDVVTCKDWRHLWLNEGFATYFDPLYHEHLLGREEFDYQMFERQQRGIETDRRLGRKPIVSVGSFGDNVYSRGAAVLHMLRFCLGDLQFWRTLNHYITKHRFQSVETTDFKVAIEEATGQNLFWFFDQWVYGAGYPIFNVSYRWIDSSRTIALSVAQTQTVDSLTGIFRTPVEVEITAGGESVTHRVNILSKDTVLYLPAPGRPSLVIFDKGNWLLKEVHFTKSNEEWLFQAEYARHPLDRIDAIRALLARQDSLSFTAVLERLAESDNFWAVRQEAVRALGSLRLSDEAAREGMEHTLIRALTDPRASIRTTAIAQLGKRSGPGVVAALKGTLQDSSYRVVAASLRALSRVDSAHAGSILREYLDTPSHDDVIAVAALSGLASTDSALARTVALETIRYGRPPQRRLAALGIIRRGARSDPDLRAVLLSLSADGNRAVRSAVLRALGEVGDERALSTLDAIAATSGDRAAAIARESATRIRSRLKKE